MSVVSAQQAANEIAAHIGSRGGGYPAWYCGVAADPGQRIFEEHNVDRESGAWIWRTCATDAEARRVEAYFLSEGCRGGGGGGDKRTCCVYAYRITTHTRE